MQNIDYIGVEKLIAAVKRQKNFSGISVLLGTKKLFYERGDKDEVLNSMKDFWDERLESNPQDQNIYEVILLDEKGKKQLNYLFCLSMPAATKQATADTGKHTQYIEMNIELGYLRSQVETLTKENTDLVLQINELEEELDGIEEDSAVGSPQETIISKVLTEERIGSFIDSLTKLFNKDQQPVSVGDPGNADFDSQALKLCQGLFKHDPKIIHHLQLLLKTAETNSFLFNHLISEIDKNLK